MELKQNISYFQRDLIYKPQPCFTLETVKLKFLYCSKIEYKVLVIIFFHIFHQAFIKCPGYLKNIKYLLNYASDTEMHKNE